MKQIEYQFSTYAMISPDKKFARPLSRSEVERSLQFITFTHLYIQIHHEHNELTSEIKKYNAAIRKLSDEIDATAKHKRKLLLKLETSRTRMHYVNKDGQRASSELYSMKSALDEYAAQVQHVHYTANVST